MTTMNNDVASPYASALSEGLGSGSAGGANLAKDPYRLDLVMMPMVRLLAEQLSWSQREQIAHAMLATLAHHKSMTNEMQAHAMNACAQQAKRAA